MLSSHSEYEALAKKLKLQHERIKSLEKRVKSLEDKLSENEVRQNLKVTIDGKEQRPIKADESMADYFANISMEWPCVADVAAEMPHTIPMDCSINDFLPKLVSYPGSVKPIGPFREGKAAPYKVNVNGDDWYFVRTFYDGKILSGWIETDMLANAMNEKIAHAFANFNKHWKK